MTVNERIRLLRELLRMNQREFAEMVGSNQTTISLIEQGNSSPSRRIINGIINNTDGLKSNWLINGVGEMFTQDSKFRNIEIEFRQVKGRNNTQSINMGESKNNSDSELIAFLKEQIRQKDEQLHQKDEQIKHLSQLLQEAMKNR